METIKLDGLEIRVVRSRRRTVCLRIAADGQAEILAPKYAKGAELERIAREYLERIRSMKEKKDRQIDARSRFSLNYGDRVRFLGEEREIRESDAGGFDGRYFYIRGGLGADEIRAAVTDIYKLAAKKHITERTAEISAKFGFEMPTVKINSAKSHWGSCSKQHRTLNFSWLCMMAPYETVDYVIIHELCHMREFNHSPRFWKQVENCCADYKRHREHLKQLAALLENELW